MSNTAQATKSAITLKGSSAIICEYLSEYNNTLCPLFITNSPQIYFFRLRHQLDPLSAWHLSSRVFQHHPALRSYLVDVQG